MNTRTLEKIGDDAGFTLIELMIGIALLGLLSLLLFQGLRFGTRAWERTEDRTGRLNEVRATQLFLFDRVSRLYPLLAGGNGSERRLVFEGNEKSLSFMAPDKDGGLSRISVGLEEDGTLNTTSTPEFGGRDQQSVTRTLAKHVASLRYGYFGPTEDRTEMRWHDTWRDKMRPPLLIRVQIAFADARLQFPDTIIRPRIGADATCIYDPLTRYCGGR